MLARLTRLCRSTTTPAPAPAAARPAMCEPLEDRQLYAISLSASALPAVQQPTTVSAIQLPAVQQPGSTNIIAILIGL